MTVRTGWESGQVTDRQDRREYTYEEAAKAAGVSTETIRLRARRGKLAWGRKTNSGRPTVLLSEQDVEALRAGHPTSIDAGQPTGPVMRPDGQPTGQPDGESFAIKVLADQLAWLRDQVELERAARLRAEEGREGDRQAHAADQVVWAQTLEAERRRADEAQRSGAELKRLLDVELVQVRGMLESMRQTSKPLTVNGRGWFRRRSRA